jgi:hypothetical protein
MRPDSEPIAVRAFWGMHVEATNWSSLGNAEYAAALGLSSYALRIWRNRFADSDEKMDWRSCFIRVPGSIKVALLVACGANNA